MERSQAERREVLLAGTFPIEGGHTVFRAAAEVSAKRLKRCSNGETGTRRVRVLWLERMFRRLKQQGEIHSKCRFQVEA